MGTTVSATTVGSFHVRLVPCAAAIVSIVALPTPGLAQDAQVEDVPSGQIRYRVFAGPEGLKNLVVASIAQDSDGLLWLADQTLTAPGIHLFDPTTDTEVLKHPLSVGLPPFSIGFVP